jgi:hypothetical protein
MSVPTSSMVKCETLIDTATTLDAIPPRRAGRPPSRIGCRSPALREGRLRRRQCRDGRHEHETQASLHAPAIRRHRKRLGPSPSAATSGTAGWRAQTPEQRTIQNSGTARAVRRVRSEPQNFVDDNKRATPPNAPAPRFGSTSVAFLSRLQSYGVLGGRA